MKVLASLEQPHQITHTRLRVREGQLDAGRDAAGCGSRVAGCLGTLARQAGKVGSFDSPLPPRLENLGVAEDG